METPAGSGKIEIDQESLKHLNTTRKWTMFLAIIGFIILGLVILSGLITGTFLSTFDSGGKIPEMPGYLMIIISIVFAIVYFLPGPFLFRFSKHAAQAVEKFDRQELNKALRNLKLYFIYAGFLLIIVLTFYLAALIFAGTNVAFLK